MNIACLNAVLSITKYTNGHNGYLGEKKEYAYIISTALIGLKHSGRKQIINLTMDKLKDERNYIEPCPYSYKKTSIMHLYRSTSMTFFVRYQWDSFKKDLYAKLERSYGF